MKVLFCGAHPDDAEIFAFGTLLAWKAAGADILLSIACTGDKGSTDRTQGRNLADVRRAEAEASAALLGARLDLVGLPDLGVAPGRFRLANRLQQTILAERPAVILTHSPNDYHVDHRALAVAVAMAAGEDVPVVYVDTFKGADFLPTHFVDIAPHQERKFEAIRLHKSQKPRRYVLSALELAGRRGKQATGDAQRLMEAFRFDPSPRFRSARGLFPPGTLAARSIVLPAPNGRVLAAGSYQINLGSPGTKP